MINALLIILGATKWFSGSRLPPVTTPGIPITYIPDIVGGVPEGYYEVASPNQGGGFTTEPPGEASPFYDRLSQEQQALVNQVYNSNAVAVAQLAQLAGVTDFQNPMVSVPTIAASLATVQQSQYNTAQSQASNAVATAQLAALAGLYGGVFGPGLGIV
jgi:hypothetical protein